MGLAPLRVVVLGTFAFWVFWVLAVFPSFKLLPIGRTAGALAGAALTIVFKVESPTEAYGAVDLSILGLLFGTMMVSVYLEKADMFRYLGNMLSWKSRGGKDLLCRVCLFSAISSALFTNDTSCVVLTEFVLKLCRQKNLPPKPFLIALATSANIGSVATPIGNPQNLVIAVTSGISFGRFLLGLLPSMALGVMVNTILLLLVYWKQLSSMEDLGKAGLSSLGSNGITKEQLTASPWTPFHSGNHQSSREIFSENASEGLNDLGVPNPEEASEALKKDPELKIDVSKLESSQVCDGEGDYTTRESLSPLEVRSKSPIREQQSNSWPPSQVCDAVNIETSPHHDEGDYTIQESLSSPEVGPKSPIRKEQQTNSRPPSRIQSSWSPSREKMSGTPKWKKRVWKSAVYFVTIAMLAALLYGLNLSWTALTAAVTLMAIDFCDAGPNLEKVSYPLLVFFAGMFITVDGFNKTGIPSTFWETVEPHARINHPRGVVLLALVVIILSNVASNVPTVLLLGSRVSQSAAANGASVTRAWLILAWASTVAGNLTLVGSAANLIVSEQAMKAQFLGYDLTFFSHLVFGFPSTLIVTAIGLPLIKGSKVVDIAYLILFVPLEQVLLLGSRVSQSAAANGASVTRAWLILAWASTVAGNLTLVGSAANLIVSEQAMKAQFLGYDLTFFSHLVFGFPSTLIVTAIGLPLIKG